MKVILFSVLVLLSLILLSTNKGNITNFLDTFNFIPKAEAFTELYFTNPSLLPSSSSFDHHYRFTFVIHNVEQKDMTYLYEVLQTRDGQSEVVEDNYVTVNNNTYKNIPVDVSVNDAFTKDRVTVRLINMNQQIEFWIHGSQ